MILAIVSALWVASEILVAVIRRAKAGAAKHDRGSLALLWLAIGGAIYAAARLQFYKPTRLAPNVFWIGIALMLLGILVRAIAIATLWRFFTVSVTIHGDHELIEHGLYRWIRHPAYTGSLLSFLGLGLAFRNWLSVAIIMGVTLIAFAYRVRVEEGALLGHFGEKYRAYMGRTKRFVPLLW